MIVCAVIRRYRQRSVDLIASSRTAPAPSSSPLSAALQASLVAEPAEERPHVPPKVATPFVRGEKTPV